MYAELAKSMGKEGWSYKDLPNMTKEYFDKFKEIVGEGNIEFITYATRTWPDNSVTYRGQVLISPQGMENISQRSFK